MELATAGFSPASYGHQVIWLGRILWKMISMHLGKGHYPYAVSYALLVLFSLVQSVLWSDSARPISRTVKSATALPLWIPGPSAALQFLAARWWTCWWPLRRSSFGGSRTPRLAPAEAGTQAGFSYWAEPLCSWGGRISDHFCGGG